MILIKDNKICYYGYTGNRVHYCRTTKFEDTKDLYFYPGFTYPYIKNGAIDKLLKLHDGQLEEIDLITGILKQNKFSFYILHLVISREGVLYLVSNNETYNLYGMMVFNRYISPYANIISREIFHDEGVLTIYYKERKYEYDLQGSILSYTSNCCIIYVYNIVERKLYNVYIHYRENSIDFIKQAIEVEFNQVQITEYHTFVNRVLIDDPEYGYLINNITGVVYIIHVSDLNDYREIVENQYQLMVKFKKSNHIYYRFSDGYYKSVKSDTSMPNIINFNTGPKREIKSARNV